MAANKFILVPEDIYRGLTSADTGNITLDFAKKALENIKREKANPAIKNVHYNQELRRYLHLKKKHEDRPIKVEHIDKPVKAEVIKKSRTAEGNEIETDDGLSGISTFSRSSPPVSTLGDRTLEWDRGSATTGADTEYDTASEDENEADPKIPSPNISERSIQLVSIFKSKPDKYKITIDGKILNTNGKVIPGSNIENSLRWILRNKAGDKLIAKKPNGTKYIEDIIDKDPMLKTYATPIRQKAKEPELDTTPKTFRQRLWTND